MFIYRSLTSPRLEILPKKRCKGVHRIGLKMFTLNSQQSLRSGTTRNNIYGKFILGGRKLLPCSLLENVHYNNIYDAENVARKEFCSHYDNN